jgi:hypothetical protein
VDDSRYKEITAEFGAATDYATSVSHALVGLFPAEEHQRYGEQIFVKLLAHCVTLQSLSPAVSPRSNSEFWDLSSASVVARAAVEAFDALAYIALQEVGPDQREFRILLWELHDANRSAKMLEYIGSRDPRFAEVKAAAAKLHERVMQHSCFGTLPKGLQRKVHEHDPPPFVNSQRERCIDNGINHDYFNAVTMQLSQYAHTLPFAVHQLFSFRAGDPESLRMMSLPLQFTLPFLLRATEGVRALFANATPEPPEGVGVSMLVWREISEQGVKNAG